MSSLARGTQVRKTKGSSWQGLVVGEYSTSLTPDGICVESDSEPGSVQIYPVHAVEVIAESKRVLPESDDFYRGAREEARLTYDGMTKKSKEVFDCVKAIAQRGDSADELTRFTATVFTADWGWRKRLDLAIEIVFGRRIAYKFQRPIVRK